MLNVMMQEFIVLRSGSNAFEANIFGMNENAECEWNHNESATYKMQNMINATFSQCKPIVPEEARVEPML